MLQLLFIMLLFYKLYFNENFVIILASEIAKTSSLMKGILVEDIGNVY